MLSMFNVEKRKIVANNMLVKLVDSKPRFSEHYHQIKKPRKIDDFLCRHFQTD